MKQIKDHYIESFNQIRRKHGYTSSGYEIPVDISLEGAVGYTRQYIIETGKEHYRYDYYTKCLASTLDERGLNFNPANNRIMHLDLGCGPGLFSWVVRDYAIENYGKKPGDIELVGYDHAESMIRLAHLFRDRLPEYNFEGYYELDKIQHMLESKDLSDYDCIITFGYVLVQVEGKREALQNFIDIIRLLFPVNSCILMAVDAFSEEDRRQKFGNACEELWDSLSNTGINARDRDIENSEYRSWMRSRLSKEK